MYRTSFPEGETVLGMDIVQSRMALLRMDCGTSIIRWVRDDVIVYDVIKYDVIKYVVIKYDTDERWA